MDIFGLTGELKVGRNGYFNDESDDEEAINKVEREKDKIDLPNLNVKNGIELAKLY